MAIEELADVVPPPGQPIDRGDLQQWKVFEKQLALQLPTDLFDLAHTYGTGFFLVEAGDAIKIRNPFSEEYWHWLVSMCRCQRMIKENSQSANYSFGIYPDSVGLLPIGSDADMGMLYWHTVGSPAEWPIIANPPGYRVFERFDMSLTNFLAKCFTAEIQCVLWGEQTFAANPRVFFRSTKSQNPRSKE